MMILGGVYNPYNPTFGLCILFRYNALETLFPHLQQDTCLYFLGLMCYYLQDS
jgi:hypothetical protein